MKKYMAKISNEDHEEYFSEWTRIDGKRLVVLIFGQGSEQDILAKEIAKTVDRIEKNATT